MTLSKTVCSHSIPDLGPTCEGPHTDRHFSFGIDIGFCNLYSSRTIRDHVLQVDDQSSMRNKTHPLECEMRYTKHDFDGPSCLRNSAKQRSRNRFATCKAKSIRNTVLTSNILVKLALTWSKTRLKGWFVTVFQIRSRCGFAVEYIYRLQRTWNVVVVGRRVDEWLTEHEKGQNVNRKHLDWNLGFQTFNTSFNFVVIFGNVVQPSRGSVFRGFVGCLTFWSFPINSCFLPVSWFHRFHFGRPHSVNSFGSLKR